MSLNYLDESDTDEEDTKLSKDFTEIQIAEAQLRCSALKGVT